MSLVVAALGGNALIRRGEDGSTDTQRRNLAVAARSLVDLVEAGHQLLITHGNGPQVGYLAIQADAARATVPSPPLDVLVAESQGQIGYLLVQALTAELAARGQRRSVVALLGHSLVDPADPAFERPSKPIGPGYEQSAAEELARSEGWSVAPDGARWRRVVASPEPLGVVEAPVIGRLVVDGFVVIAAGGGGIPVAQMPSGALVGVEAVVDKDLAALRLAEAVRADALLLLTDVEAAHTGWGSPDRRPIRRLTVTAALEGIRDGTFPPGSMGPKVDAAMRFVRDAGRQAAIGALDQALALLEGRAGTQLVADWPGGGRHRSGRRFGERDHRRQGVPRRLATEPVKS